MRTVHKIIFSLIVLFLISCGSSKIFEEPQVVLQVSAVDSLVQGKYIYVKVDSAQTVKLKFDTGATETILNDIAMIGGKAVLTKGNHTTQKGYSGSGLITTIAYETKSLNTKVSHATNQKIAIYDMTTTKIGKCFPGFFSYDGLYGLDAFAEAKDPKPVLLNYNNDLIKILSETSQIPPDYHKVDASFKDNKIYLHGTIAGGKMDFLFDTGYNGFVVLSKNIFKDKNIDSKVSGKSMFTSASESIIPEKSLVFQDVPISIAGIPIEENMVSIIKKMDTEEAYVGLSLIENYNWILDFKHETLYAKKIKNYDSNTYFETLKDVKYVALAYDGKLIVVFSNGKKYQVGDVIKSVKGKKVTDENICKLLKILLKNNEDWSNLNVETR